MFVRIADVSHNRFIFTLHVCRRRGVISPWLAFNGDLRQPAYSSSKQVIAPREREKNGSKFDTEHTNRLSHTVWWQPEWNGIHGDGNLMRFMKDCSSSRVTFQNGNKCDDKNEYIPLRRAPVFWSCSDFDVFLPIESLVFRHRILRADSFRASIPYANAVWPSISSVPNRCHLLCCPIRKCYSFGFAYLSNCSDWICSIYPFDAIDCNFRHFRYDSCISSSTLTMSSLWLHARHTFRMPMPRLSLTMT